MMKKIWEKIYAEWFLKNIGLDYCEIIDSECPDFILDCDNKRIGLEVTNIYKDIGKHGSIQKMDEHKTNRWLNQLSRLYYKNNSQSIELQISNYRDNELPEQALLLEEIVKHLPNRQFDTTKFEYKCKQSQNACLKLYITLLPEELSGYKRWTYLNNNRGFSREIGINELNRIINIKKSKAKNYAEELDEILLIIVADSSRNSGMLHLNNKGINLSCSEFKQIYFVKHLLEITKIG